jgi:cyclophilin family peptidyl-prolyl cis-trans isomerase
MTVRSPKFLLAVAASAAVLVTACSGAGATTAPTRVPASAAPASRAPSAAAPASGSAAGGGASTCPKTAPAPLPAGQTRTVTISTSQGTIAIKVDGSLSPNAAGNFVALAQCGFYNGVVFHRLVPGFVIQGGDPTGTGTGGPGYTIKDEPVKGEYKRGTVAMARSSQPNSQGSQFFIVLDDQAGPALESYRTYAIFGSVVTGMDTVDKIAAMPNSGDQAGNQAVNPVAMTAVTVTTP